MIQVLSLESKKRRFEISSRLEPAVADFADRIRMLPVG